MGAKDRQCQKVSSFAWCLRPPTAEATTPRNRNISSCNQSLLPSNYRPKEARLRSRHSPELTVEPTSPRVGCMGQIRRRKAPTGAATGSGHSSSTSSSVSPRFNLLMLKRGASGSVNTSSSPSSSSSTSSVSSSASPTSVIAGELSLLVLKRVSSTRVTFEEMDPPRPVERKEAKPENSVSLWRRRRCGGGGGLQLKLRPTEQIGV